MRVTSSKLVTKPGTADPKAVVTFYEDFLCPNCGLGAGLRSDGVQADRHRRHRGRLLMLAILDNPRTHNYSSRAGGAALCVADESIDLFRRFHSALFSPHTQP